MKIGPGLRDWLIDLGVEVSELDPADALRVERRWLETFARRVKQEHGVWVYRGFRWHGFSYGLEPCQEGPPALEAYLRAQRARYYVFDESVSFCALCHSPSYPDLSHLRQDIYVCHRNMHWTMAFTHEQPAIGPFFVGNTAG